MSIGDAMSNNSYRIMKLKSGEEVIATIKGQDKDRFIVERPMVFKTTTIQNPYGSMKYVTVLQDWLSNSAQITTKIPKDFIMTFLDPSKEAIKLYNLEKKHENEINVKYNNEDSSEEENFNLHDFIQDTFNVNKPLDDEIPPKEIDSSDVVENLINDIINSKFDDELGSEKGMDLPEENYISMTLFFPPDALLSLVEANLLDIEDVKEMISSINKPKKKKKKRSPRSNPDHPNFGNRWFDWSDDLDDYR